MNEKNINQMIVKFQSAASATLMAEYGYEEGERMVSSLVSNLDNELRSIDAPAMKARIVANNILNSYMAKVS